MEVYTIPEAAKVTGRTAKAIRLEIERGGLEAVEHEGARVIERSALERAGLLGEGPERLAEPPPGEERFATEGSVRALSGRVERLASELGELRREHVDQLERRIAELERGLPGGLRQPAIRDSPAPLFEAAQDADPA